MTNHYLRAVCVLAVVIALPAAAFAQQRGGPQRSAAPPQGRAAAPAMRPAPVQAAPQPQARPVAPARPAGPANGGFNFNHDIAPAPVAQQRPAQQPPAAAPQRQAAPAPFAQRQAAPAPFAQRPAQQPPAAAPQRPVAQRPATEQRPVAQAPAGPQRAANGRTAPPAGYRSAPVSNRTGGPLAGRFTGPIVRNTRETGGSYGWNHGVTWQPAPIYWGGGFWGPYAVGDLATLAIFGWIADDQSQVVYDSYQLEPDSPGWQLLQDYQLQQTPCGPPDLVVIWGPDDSVVCAYPNNLVGPGNYDVDPATFGLVSASP
jgi:hypothetical protein